MPTTLHNDPQTPSIKGWCPGARRPMLTGDGLVVRVRPRLARLNRAQALGLCEAALRHGSGQLELTNRANLQIRGVSETRWPALIAELDGLGLLDASVEQESRRNVLLAPDWVEGDDTHRIVPELLQRLAQLPADFVLPAKTGFAVDVGSGRWLAQDSADFRLERSIDGGLILRADGRALGAPVALADAAEGLIELARWFVASGGREAGRMARHKAPLPDWAREQVAPAAGRPALQVGAHPLGTFHGVEFGQLQARDLLAALERTGASGLRTTPWRLLLLEGAAPVPLPGLALDARWEGQHIHACAGTEGCPQASVATRPLARRLAGLSPGHLHVSGCAKGCAFARKAAVCVTGRQGRFDIAFNALALDPPSLQGLDADQVVAALEQAHALSV